MDGQYRHERNDGITLGYDYLAPLAMDSGSVGFYRDAERDTTVRHGDYCAVVLTMAHPAVSTIDTVIVHTVINYRGRIGQYSFPTRIGMRGTAGVYSGDYCVVNDDALWLVSMVNTYGHGGI